MFKKRNVKGKGKSKSENERKSETKSDEDPQQQRDNGFSLKGNDYHTSTLKIVKPDKGGKTHTRVLLSKEQAERVIDTLNSTQNDISLKDDPDNDNDNDNDDKNTKSASESAIKANITLDYQRDVCKDFLKNGYCGFGDTCKFLHYREEYQRVERKGEQDWEKVSKRKRY